MTTPAQLLLILVMPPRSVMVFFNVLPITSQKMKFSIMDFFSKRDQKETFVQCLPLGLQATFLEGMGLIHKNVINFV